MKKFFIFVFLISGFFSFFNVSAQDVYSRETYEYVSSFDGTATSTTFENTSARGIAVSINFILTLMAVSIIVLIIFRVIQGAVIKGTLDNIYQQTKGRSLIQNAGIALIIFIFSYAILSFINPRLTGWTLATKYANTAFRDTLKNADTCNPNEKYSNTEDVLEMLMQDEGNRTSIYTDTTGHLSIGVGFNLNREAPTVVKNDLMKAGILDDVAEKLIAGDRDVTITQEQVKKLLENDIEEHRRMAIDFAGGESNFNSHPENIQNVLINMTFNMGSGGIASFKKMQEALKNKDYEGVAKEIVDSKYCSQVGGRCSRLANLAAPNYCIAYQQQLATNKSLFGGTKGSWPGVSINDTVIIHNVRVGKSIETQARRLLDALVAANINFDGTTSWRTYEKQVELRKTNGCPDIINSPSNACKVPTAKPGTSRHEAGVAFDFQYEGKTLCFPNATCVKGTNPLYDWLVANAEDYGFYKNSKEAWHWSVDGK